MYHSLTIVCRMNYYLTIVGRMNHSLTIVGRMNHFLTIVVGIMYCFLTIAMCIISG